ncbi:hypothetical protein VTP01DRAFT_1774 [Rhizomucor pusillus]|uniref:uncharacterized protein n=1 Tax=Rhizomucor pusillus TaxID=4840 RepID=UPI0037426208
MVELLQTCENYSLQTGYRWNPAKCVILDNHPNPIDYKLYSQPLPRQSSFAYLGIPFKPGGFLDPQALVHHDCSKAIATMNFLNSIGVNLSGFSKLLSSRFYAHIVRPQLEYGLAINTFCNSELKQLEDTQNKCMRKIYGTHDRSSPKVILHIANLPTMVERVHILQAQFLFHSLTASEDTLLGYLLPHVKHRSNRQWTTLSKTALWRRIYALTESLTPRTFHSVKKDYLLQRLIQRMHASAGV